MRSRGRCRASRQLTGRISDIPTRLDAGLVTFHLKCVMLWRDGHYCTLQRLEQQGRRDRFVVHNDLDVRGHPANGRRGYWHDMVSGEEPLSSAETLYDYVLGAATFVSQAGVVWLVT